MSSSNHPSILAFLGRQSDDEHDYFAYEKCGKSLRDFVNQKINDRTNKKKNAYKEMSEQSIKIMSGLVSGVSYLHARKIIHNNISLENIYIIYITDDYTIKIGGLRESRSVSQLTDAARLDDLYDVGQALLFYMSEGRHKRPSDRTPLMRYQFCELNIDGTTKEVWHLLQMLRAGVGGEGYDYGHQRNCASTSLFGLPLNDLLSSRTSAAI